MSFRKPFRAAVPIVEGEAYRKKRKRKEWVRLAKQGISWSAIAIGVGGLTGYLTATGNDGQPRAAALMSGVRSGKAALKVADVMPTYYAYCDHARAAGKAPIYAGEPGYRPGLDRDNDGIACEPYQ